MVRRSDPPGRPIRTTADLRQLAAELDATVNESLARLNAGDLDRNTRTMLELAAAGAMLRAAEVRHAIKQGGSHR